MELFLGDIIKLKQQSAKECVYYATFVKGWKENEKKVHISTYHYKKKYRLD